MSLFLTEYTKPDGSTWAGEGIRADSFAQAISMAPPGVRVLGELVYSEEVDDLVAVCVERGQRREPKLMREVITKRDISINVTMRKSWEQNYNRNISVVRAALIVINLGVMVAVLAHVL